MRALLIGLGLLLLATLAWWFAGGSTPALVAPGETGLVDPDIDTPTPLGSERAALRETPATTPPPDTRQQTLVVTVRQAGSGAPLESFELRLRATAKAPWTTVAGTGGTHALDLAPGTYELDCQAPGHASLPQPIEVTVRATSAPPALEIELERSAPTVAIRVLDQTTNRPIARFRATVRRGASAAEFLPELTTQPLHIEGAAGKPATVTIEAEGYRPAPALELTFTADSTRTVFLVPQAPFAGIELRVHDAAQRPIPRIGVVAHELRRGQPAKLLWNRATASADGAYRLPDLGPGRYRLAVTAVDEAGNPTLHQSVTKELEYLDGQHLLEPITLQAGAMIELVATDPTGRTIGTDVWIQLTHPDGAVHESIWQHTAAGKADPQARLGADMLTKDAPARLHRCLAPGRYSLTIRWGDGPAVVRPLDLRAGERRRVDVQLSK